MPQGERVALAVGVEHAKCEGPHERALLLAPRVLADRPYDRADLGGNAWATRAAALHQLAHSPLAHLHAGGGVGAREPLQVAERGRLALALIQAHAQGLEELAQAHAVVELLCDVSLERAHVGARRRSHARARRGKSLQSELAPAVRSRARSMLVERSAVGDEREPRGRTGDLLTLEHGHVEPLPGLGIGGLEIGVVEDHTARREAAPHARQHAPAQGLELLAQQALGTVAAQA